MIFQPERQKNMSKKSMVTVDFDVANPPPMTAEQKAEMQKLALMPDSAIDFSDIPRLDPNAAWYRPGPIISADNKLPISLRLDAEVVTYFKNTGKRYQSRMNAVLRQYVDAMQAQGITN
jgi:uncharacterized protein (DUF4415 family)